MKILILVVCLLMVLRNGFALRAGFAAKRLFLLLFWAALGIAAVFPLPLLRILAFVFLILGLLTPQRRPAEAERDDRGPREVKNITPPDDADRG